MNLSIKHPTTSIPLVLASLLASASLPAAVPLLWTVETSRATPAQFEAYQGETLALEAALKSYGKPLEAPSNYSLYWQTNGMGSTYCSVPCPVPTSSLVGAPTNVLFATWSPTNDVGARAYNCFIGQPGTIYHAAFQLRLRQSPGATPNELPLPQKVIDFAKVTVLNPPWSGGGGGGCVDTNAVREIVREEIAPATNAVNVAMTNRYTKAETDSKIAEAVDANEKTGTAEQIVRGELIDELSKIWNINVMHAEQAEGADYAGIADTLPWAYWEGTDHPTTLSGYGIEDGATKTELDDKRSYGDLSYAPTRSIATIGALSETPSDGSILKALLVGIGEVKIVEAEEDADYATPSYVDGKVSAAISATDPTFSNAVATVARKVTPQPSQTLRLYDEVRQCWWIGKMVNGVINWEVE